VASSPCLLATLPLPLPTGQVTATLWLLQAMPAAGAVGGRGLVGAEERAGHLHILRTLSRSRSPD
jgi:hypothetical protein